MCKLCSLLNNKLGRARVMKKIITLLILLGMMTLSGCIRSDFSKSKKYFVHIYYYEDVMSRPYTVYENETLEEALRIPNKPFHRFLYWETPTGEKYYPEDTIHQNLFLTPIYEEILYLVTFETNGGTSIDPQWVREGFLYEPPITTKDDFIFYRWYTDINLNHEFKSYEPLKAPVTLYARWVRRNYIITFYFSEIVYYVYSANSTQPFPIIDTSRYNNFSYWYEKDPNVPFVIPETMIKRDIVLYAKYN